METVANKKNLIQLAAERKAAGQANQSKSTFFSNQTPKKFGAQSNEKYFRPTKPGGRNGQGKP